MATTVSAPSGTVSPPRWKSASPSRIAKPSACSRTVASGRSTRVSPVRDMAPEPTPSAQAVERALEALVELDLRLPAQLVTRARGVERDVLHLAGALGGVLGLEAVVRVRVQHLDDVEQALLLAEADVDRTRGVRLGGAQVGIHHVVHKDVVARLLAASEDRGPATVEDLPAEDRDHAGLAERVLARAVDVAVAQRHRGESVQAGEDLAVLLGAPFREAVGGLGRAGVVLRGRDRAALAVDGAPG